MDEKIFPLVRKLNEYGFPTYSSCQGHGWPLFLPPFVAFRVHEKNASALSRILRDDAESPDPKLSWEWLVDASFDCNHQLTYRVTIANPRWRIYRWLRPLMDRDLLLLPNFVEIAVKNVKGWSYPISKGVLCGCLPEDRKYVSNRLSGKRRCQFCLLNAARCSFKSGPSMY